MDKSYTVDEDNQNFCSIDGALYTKDKKTLIYYPAGVKNAKVADGTEIIEEGAFFDKTDIESVVIPESVKSIYELAFLNCTNLNSVTLPDNAEIGKEAIGYYYENPLLASAGMREQLKIPNFTIFGNPDTDGERYATENGFKFVDLTAPDDSS